MARAALDPDLVVEVLHNAGDERNPDWSVGSGFLVGGRLVLTAAHNCGGGTLLIRAQGNQEHPAKIRLKPDDDSLDMAVLEVTSSIPDAPWARYGIVDRRGASVVKECRAIGFPRFKERPTGGNRLRNSVQLDGEIPTGENIGRQLLTLRVTTAPRPLPTGRTDESEWQGISGAVVFTRDVVLGVITEHHLPEGESSLGVVPITAIDGLAEPKRSQWWNLLGVNPTALTAFPSELESRPEGIDQLDPDIEDFTGRSDRLTEIRRLLQSTRQEASHSPVTVAIFGMAGVGKSALAIRAANQVRERFPDRLYVNLRGVEEQRLEPGAVLAEFLRALGVQGPVLPEALDDRSRLYREKLAHRRVLVVLDNAAAESQVRPLLPGSPTCAALITSRARMAALEGAHHIDLDVLDPDQALELLGKVAGEGRVAAEPEPAKRIVKLCGYLPLAVRIAGEWLALRSHWHLSMYAIRLNDEQRRLTELRVGDREVRASFSLSYRMRDEGEQRTFRVLGLLPFADFPPWVAAALLNQDLEGAEETVERLVEGQLLEVAGEDSDGRPRYRFHDLLRVFAREHLQEESLESRRAGVQRVLEGYLDLVEQAGLLVFPHGRRDESDLDTDRWRARELGMAVPAEPDDAIAWFTGERSNLVHAVEQGFQDQFWEVSWELADKLSGFFRLLDYWGDWQRTHELALDAARKASNRRGEAWILRNLGNAYRDQSRFEEAFRYFDQALAIFQELDNRLGEAATINALGDVCLDRSRFEEALGYFDRCLPMFSDLADRLAETYTNHSVGRIYLQQGRLDEAEGLIDRTLAAFGDLSDAVGEAWAYLSMAELRGQQQRFREARTFLDRCSVAMRHHGDRIGEAWAIRTAGLLDRDEGHPLQARANLKEALRRFRELRGRRGEAYTLQSLGTLDFEEGALNEIRGSLEQAVSIFRELGDRLQEARTLASLAQLFAAAGDPARAEGTMKEAIVVFDELGGEEGKEGRAWLNDLLQSPGGLG
jgi:tetratricopeptide (TPR) repeat protein